MQLADKARLAALVDEHSTEDRLSRVNALCVLCRKATGASGVALSVAGPGAHRVTSTVCGTDALSMYLEELQLALAEGPIADALESTFPVLAPDLTDAMHVRWLWFAPAAVEAGAVAVFVLPLCADGARLGALSLYRNIVGDLTAGQFDDFRVFADAATEIVCPTHAAPGDESDAWTIGPGTGFQPQIHQAVGVIMAALNVDAEHALARLRGHAFATEQPISRVARNIVSRRLQLEPDAA